MHLERGELQPTKIPSQDDWAGYEDDLDARYAYRVFFGRSIEEVVPLFHENPIERCSELSFMPVKPFRYYILAFRDYLLSEQSREDSDAASCYLRLIVEKIDNEPATIGPVLPALRESVQQVAESQAFYDADPHIYGNFREIAARILAACD